MIKPLLFCDKCKLVIFKEEEIEEKEKAQIMTMCCSMCSRNFHKGCVTINDMEDWLCEECIASLL